MRKALCSNESIYVINPRVMQKDTMLCFDEGSYVKSNRVMQRIIFYLNHQLKLNVIL